MSDVMMFGIAKMPYEMAMGDELSRRQFYSNTQRLAAALEAAQEQLDWAVKENDRLLAEGSELTARAERLAEALRHLRNHTSVNSHQIELIDAALHPTAAQEGKNDGQGCPYCKQLTPQQRSHNYHA